MDMAISKKDIETQQIVADIQFEVIDEDKKIIGLKNVPWQLV